MAIYKELSFAQNTRVEMTIYSQLALAITNVKMTIYSQ